MGCSKTLFSVSVINDIFYILIILKYFYCLIIRYHLNPITARTFPEKSDLVRYARYVTPGTLRPVRYARYVTPGTLRPVHTKNRYTLLYTSQTEFGNRSNYTNRSRKKSINHNKISSKDSSS